MSLFDFARRVIDIMDDFNSSEQTCPECGAQLERDNDLEEWICPECGFSGYTSLDGGAHIEENEEDDFDDDDEMPECCVACGGPYPSCKTSCKIFDD